MEYLYAGTLYLMTIIVVRVILATLGLFLGKKGFLRREKLRSFECGFDPIERSRNTFSLRFFLLAIVFLIFDIELVLFLPYIFSLIVGRRYFCKISTFVFVIILFGGLVHEFNEGSLD